MENYKYLILAEVGESPALVLADNPPPSDGFVAFHDGAGIQLGEIVNHCMIDTEGAECSMFSALYPIFDAVKMYGCCYEKEDGHDGS